MVALQLVAEKPPMAEDNDGVLRVGGTRVSLESVIYAFHNGSTPEEVIFKYPSLKLQDVYSVISYYLSDSEAIESYLNARISLIADSDREIESRFPSAGVRERLLARRIS